MADADRGESRYLELIRELRSRPHAFDFFEALRRFEAVARATGRSSRKLGQTVRSAEDPLRLGQEPDLGFPPSTIASFDARGSGAGKPKLSVRFFGLFGPNGPLPLHLTEYARQRERSDHDPTLAAFADVFHHRLLSLFFRLRADACPTSSFSPRSAQDSPSRSESDRDFDRFSFYVGSLAGVGFDSQGSRDVLPDLAKLRFAGRLGRGPRNADGVRGILEGYLRVPVRVEPFVGEWLPLPEAYHCRLDSGASPRRLGIDAYAGTKTYACQHKFRIVLGPMGFEDYRRLLPGGTSMRRLAAAVRNYIGDELVFDVRLVLAREEVPSAVLGEGARLGWTSWVKNRPRDVDAADLLIRPAEYA